jgi:hypothetical protein
MVTLLLQVAWQQCQPPPEMDGTWRHPYRLDFNGLNLYWASGNDFGYRHVAILREFD